LKLVLMLRPHLVEALNLLRELLAQQYKHDETHYLLWLRQNKMLRGKIRQFFFKRLH